MEALASCSPSFVLWYQHLLSYWNQDPRSHLKLSENLLEMYILRCRPIPTKSESLGMELDDLYFMTGHPDDSESLWRLGAPPVGQRNILPCRWSPCILSCNMALGAPGAQKYLPLTILQIFLEPNYDQVISLLKFFQSILVFWTVQCLSLVPVHELLLLPGNPIAILSPLKLTILFSLQNTANTLPLYQARQLAPRPPLSLHLL